METVTGIAPRGQRGQLAQRGQPALGDDEMGAGDVVSVVGGAAGDEDFVEVVGLADGFVVLDAVGRGFGRADGRVAGVGTGPPPVPG
jgi:hypothetical protein